MTKEIQKLNINKLIPYINNPRINYAAIEAVAESIKQCGYLSPIVIDESRIILAGHTRYEALKRLQYKEVPVLICRGLSEEQKKKFRLLDNKTGEFAEWDFNKLAMEIEGLDFEGFDFKLEEEVLAEDFTDDFTLPDGDKPEMCTMSFNLKEQQWALISASLEKVAPEITETFENKQIRGNALYTIAKQLIDMRSESEYADFE